MQHTQTSSTKSLAFDYRNGGVATAEQLRWHFELLQDRIAFYNHATSGLDGVKVSDALSSLLVAMTDAFIATSSRRAKLASEGL